MKCLGRVTAAVTTGALTIIACAGLAQTEGEARTDWIAER